MLRRGESCSKIIILMLFSVILVSLSLETCYAANEPDYVGFVVDDATDEPISDVDVTVYYRRIYRRYYSRWYKGVGTSTDHTGRFELDLAEDNTYLILLTHGEYGDLNYVPFGKYINPLSATEADEIRLWRAQQVVLDGSDFFVETTAIPEITYRAIDVSETSPLSYGSLGVYFGTQTGSLTDYLDLPSDIVYMPSGIEHKLRVTAVSEYLDDTLVETIILDDESYSEVVDLSSIVLPRNIEVIQNKTETTGRIIEDKENQGFYLAVERQKLGRAKTLFTSSMTQIEVGQVEEAFTSLREAYVILTDLENSVSGMHDSATRSVSILIVFIGLTSQVVAGLFFDDAAKRTVSGTIVFAILLGTLYVLHPGTQITEQNELIRIGAVTIVSVSALGWIGPKIISNGNRQTSPSVQHMVVPIISIAKRSLRRRRLRFLLTLTSVLMLVASFISLTSFTTGFGLSLEKTHLPLGKEGLLIRTTDPPPVIGTAPYSGGLGVAGSLPLDSSLIDWFSEDIDVQEVIPRYENAPRRQYREEYSPVTRIEGEPVFGVLSVDPSYEAAVNTLDTTVVDGRYIGEGSGEAMISVALSEQLGKPVGDTLSFGLMEYSYDFVIVGLMGDDKLAELLDIDGEPYLPLKIIEWSRVEYDGPDDIVEALAPCTPDEVVITNHASSVNMTLLGLSRINLVVDDNIDKVEFARTTALNRGFRVWASTEGGVYLAQLEEYFGGKGLPVIIPWIIVVLNVMVTMMNAYYERRKEVMIFSSIGMNPRHVSAVFLAEATVTGVLGGCLGYLLGLGAYRFIYLVTPALQVQQKVSAVWSLGAIGISLAAVLIGGMIALRNSVSITPSLLRRWKIDSVSETDRITKIELPIHVFPEELKEYYEFLEDKLSRRKTRGDMRVSMLKFTEDMEETYFNFVYSSYGSNISSLYTRNKVVIEVGSDGTYTTTLYSDGDSDSVKKVGELMRRVCLDWSMEREEH